MKKIAITGGIGSGKSCALKYFQEKGFPVFSCDEIYRSILSTNAYIDEVRRIFPSAVVNGKIDKNILSELVFANVENREKLNALAHPIIMRTLFKNMNACDTALVFAEVPLLFETRRENDFDIVLVMIRNKEERIQSVKIRDNQTKENIKKRIDAQFNYSSNEFEEIKKNSKIKIIENNFDKNTLYKKFEEFLQNELQS